MEKRRGEGEMKRYGEKEKRRGNEKIWRKGEGPRSLSFVSYC